MFAGIAGMEDFPRETFKMRPKKVQRPHAQRRIFSLAITALKKTTEREKQKGLYFHLYIAH